MEHAEILICGGGIIGLTLARELVSRGADNILILEKEEEIGRHASGRNSGVLHTGIYYPAGSLKARLCLRGNRLMKAYCLSRGLPLQETGKVVVARHEGELPVLHKLHATASGNGATVELIDERQLDACEPLARTHQMALRSADTAIVDPKAILRCLVHDLLETGRVRLLTGTAFIGLKQTRTAETSRGPVRFRSFINAAGAYSDTIAHCFGLARQFRLIPFKGTYRELRSGKASLVKGNIYPVPDLRNPFLGVHFTRSIHDHVYVGPTAIPAFGRENYRLLEKLTGESLRILFDDARLFFLNQQFRTVALTEPRKYLARYFFEDAKSLVKALSPDDLGPCEKVGIRPQLVDWEKKELVMDFLVLKEQESLHILNAISPAFTSSMAFAEYVASEYLGTPLSS
ncbi:MAG: L-2-hydroxyglutarate oxidase [Nitrospirota bacterium]|nr:L-2-hydroxyglutarate oxidase [Nitrospirota bacterium]